ncbi:hypothetical protein [Sediminicola arcticus]|jgi:hypothetical protein|uniref:Peptidoglycan-binding protein LysM n=1 Tax=Sediminicola arcticus TaxID=1574308 RepID=A0ABV2ST48_9FLAO
MRRWINVFCPLIMIFILMSFGFNSASNKIMEVPFTLKVNEPTAVLFPKNKTIFNPVMVAPPFLGSSYIGFKEALAFKESQGDYFTINALGYLGKYQFGIGTLQLMGVYNATRFINDPMLQERAFHTNIARNKWILRRDIKRFNGKQIGGVKVTESGILAAAHLAGAGNVKKFLRSLGEHNVSDEFGTSIANYMRKFSGYDISFISPVRNPKI